jgi:hypothetical protein
LQNNNIYPVAYFFAYAKYINILFIYFRHTMTHDDEIKDDEKEEMAESDEETTEGEVEIPEGEIHEDVEKEVDFATTSSSFSDEESGEDEDPHESFDSGKKAKAPDAKIDLYGVGAPSGFEEEEDFLGDDEEEEEEYADDSNAF